jgi:hypothetical protein
MATAVPAAIARYRARLAVLVDRQGSSVRAGLAAWAVPAVPAVLVGPAGSCSVPVARAVPADRPLSLVRLVVPVVPAVLAGCSSARAVTVVPVGRAPRV